jgi:hypothetical protein
MGGGGGGTAPLGAGGVTKIATRFVRCSTRMTSYLKEIG